MGERILSYPSIKDVLTYGLGFAIGMFMPGFFVQLISTIGQTGVAGGWLASKVQQMANMDFGDANPAQIILYAVLLIVAVAAASKATDIAKKIVLGIATGLILRILLIYAFGMPVPTFSLNGDNTSNISEGVQKF